MKYVLDNSSSSSRKSVKKQLIRSVSNKAELIDRCLILPVSAPLPENVGRYAHQQKGILPAQQQQRLQLVSWLTSYPNDLT